jgi:FkbM family methyltransferase
MSRFPDCHYLLIEAQAVHEPGLRRFVQQHPKAQYVLAAAGDTYGRIFFDATAPLGGQASYTPYPANNIEVPVTTVDREVTDRQLTGPYLLKFDTHGFEVPILKGALQTLRETDVIVMECYNFHVAPEALLFDEMCGYLKTQGFRCIDLVDPMFRPHDGAFWQMDLIFVRDDRPEFAYSLYE